MSAMHQHGDLGGLFDELIWLAPDVDARSVANRSVAWCGAVRGSNVRWSPQRPRTWCDREWSAAAAKNAAGVRRRWGGWLVRLGVNRRPYLFQLRLFDDRL